MKTLELLKFRSFLRESDVFRERERGERRERWLMMKEELRRIIYIGGRKVAVEGV